MLYWNLDNLRTSIKIMQVYYKVYKRISPLPLRLKHELDELSLLYSDSFFILKFGHYPFPVLNCAYPLYGYYLKLMMILHHTA